jgi:hypothetical protein
MSRDFNGTNENINFGSDTSIDEGGTFGNLKTIAMWVDRDVANINQFLLGKSTLTAQWGLLFGATAQGNLFRFGHAYSVAFGEWNNSTAIAAGSRHHVAMTMDGGSDLNDPTFRLNGVTESSESSSPSGTWVADDTPSLISGENSSGSQDFDGRIGFLAYDNVIWTNNQINRHRWWGVPRGGTTCKVWHPFVTDTLANKGSATANAVVTGTRIVSMVKPMRIGCMPGW